LKAKSGVIKKFRISSAVLIVLQPSSVWAVQRHGGAEGLVAHQISHFLFVLGISYLLYKICKTGFKDQGWVEFKSFLWLLISWNLLTFSGHWMDEFIAPDQFVRDGGRTIGMAVDGAWDFFFYLTHLDHLLLVPAFTLLLLALRKWERQT